MWFLTSQRGTHQRRWKISFVGQKGLFQQYPPGAAVGRPSNEVCCSTAHCTSITSAYRRCYPRARRGILPRYLSLLRHQKMLLPIGFRDGRAKLVRKRLDPQTVVTGLADVRNMVPGVAVPSRTTRGLDHVTSNNGFCKRIRDKFIRPDRLHSADDVIRLNEAFRKLLYTPAGCARKTGSVKSRAA
jgi:hypothetical protein